MDKLSMAKDLIKKGHELNDDDLIKMGHDILNGMGETAEEIDIDFTKPIEVKGDVELAPPLSKTGISNEKEYHCTACDHRFPHDKDRKRCIKCKKQKLELVDPLPEFVEQEGVAPIITKTRPSNNGESGVAAKSVPIDTNQTSYNRFKDDGTVGHDDEDKLLKKKPVSAKGTRKKHTVKPKVCENCGRSFYSPLHNEYLCTSCMMRRGR